MKAFLIIIVSLLIGLVAFGQSDSRGTDKKQTVNWKDVIISKFDSSIENTPWATGEGEIRKRNTVHSIKDLSNREVKRIKKEVGNMGGTIAYISISDSSYSTGTKIYFYDPTVYFLSVLPPKK